MECASAPFGRARPGGGPDSLGSFSPRNEPWKMMEHGCTKNNMGEENGCVS